MKVEKLVSHVRFMCSDDYVYSKERLYEKLNIDVEKNLSLKIGNVFKIEGNEYEITDIQFHIIPYEWGLDYLKGHKTLDIVDEEEDVTPTNSEILIFIKLL